MTPSHSTLGTSDPLIVRFANLFAIQILLRECLLAGNETTYIVLRLEENSHEHNYVDLHVHLSAVYCIVLSPECV